MSIKNIPSGSPVLVTTVHRGVFFGYVVEVEDNNIKLERARCCLYWPKEQKGFLGLANMGPLHGARIGPAADIVLYGITSIAACTPEAVKAWEAAPWSWGNP